MMRYLHLLVALVVFGCEPIENVVVNTLDIDNDTSILNQRIEMINQPISIFNYNAPGASLPDPRITTDNLTMALTSEMDCSDCSRVIVQDQDETLVIDEGEVVGIAEGVNVQGGVNLNGGTLVICGSLQTAGVYGAGGQIIVNETGVMDCSNLYISADVVLAVYGALTLSEGKGITLKGQLEVYNELTVERLSLSAGSNLYNRGSISVNRDIAQSGNVINRGQLSLGNNYYLNSSGILENFCRLEVDNKMSLNGTLNNCSYISIASTFYVNVHEGFTVKSKSLMEVSSIIINDDIRNETEGLGVIYYTNKYYHNAGKIDDNVLITNDESDAYIASSSCSPGFGVEPKFHLIAELNPPLYEGVELSATSVQVTDGCAYVSYHMHGEDYAAAIDVVDLSSLANLQILQQFISPDFDFNELKLDDQIVDGRRNLWVVGACRQGAESFDLESPAALLRFELNERLFDQYKPADVVDLLGNSGNSICKDGEELIAVSGRNGGISVVDYSDFTLKESYQKANLKYVSKTQEKVLFLTASDEKASLSRYASGAYANHTSLFEFDPIYPVDGKLVMYIDEDNAYVSSGKDGVKVFDVNHLDKVQTYAIEKGFVNGVSVDEQFVYIANGPDGLLIYNKNTMSIVGKYSFDGSANFVTVQDNGLIFLANGRGGLKIIYREQ